MKPLPGLVSEVGQKATSARQVGMPVPLPGTDISTGRFAPQADARFSGKIPTSFPKLVS